MIIDKAYIEDLLYGRKRSVILGSLLRLLSIIYRFLIFLRHLFYKIGFFRKRTLPQTVISVGNLTLGGTGKTPAVMNIAGILLKRKRKPVVISRGYGRRDEDEVVVVSDGVRVKTDSRSGGDEPVLISTKLLGLPVVVGSDRFQAARFAHTSFGNDTVLLDDGFQHFRLHRDIDIVLVDAADPFGSGRLFPAGILREPLSALKRADAVLITNADRVSSLDALKNVVRKYTEAEIFSSWHVPVDLACVIGGEEKPLSALRGTKVLAFSGIARPASFLAMLRGLGADIKAQVTFPDHYAYKKSDLAGIFQRAADQKISMIVTTEKDGVRLKELMPEGIWALRIELKVDENEKWEQLLLKQA